MSASQAGGYGFESRHPLRLQITKFVLSPGEFLPGFCFKSSEFIQETIITNLPDYKRFRETKVFGSLDALRCLSIVAVVWHHTAGHWVSGFRLLNVGFLGVQFFFVISGFLITTLLLREKEKYGQISLKNFYVRRSLRIFPLYYTVILLYIIVVQLVEPNSVYGLGYMSNLKYFLTYTSNWFVDLGVTRDRVIFYFAWSLATEEQFYLVWSSVEYFLKKHRPVVVALLMIGIQQAAALDIFESFLPADSFLINIATSISVAVCLGVILAHILHGERGYNILRQFVGRRWIPIVAFLLLVCSIILPKSLSPLNFTLIFFCMAIIVASCVIREDHILARVFAWGPMHLIGTVSYGMYLLHMLTYNVVKRILAMVSLDHPLMFFVITLLAATFVSWISYHYYESFFLRMKSRFSRAT